MIEVLFTFLLSKYHNFTCELNSILPNFTLKEMQWTPNLCRICGHISEGCHLIHQKGMNIEHKLKRCLNLDVYRDDFKPQQICNDCYMKLNEFHDLIEMCNLTNLRFDTILMNKQNWPNHTSVDDYSQQQQKISVIVTSKTVPDTYTCTDIDLYKDSMLPLENLNIPNPSMNDQNIVNIVENSNTYTSDLGDNIDNINQSTYEKPYEANNYYYNTSVLHHSSDYSLAENQSKSEPTLNYDCQQKTDQVASKTACNNFYYEELTYTEPCNNNIAMEFTHVNKNDKQLVEKAVEKARKMRRPCGKLISVEAIRNYITPNPECVKMKKSKKTSKFFECNQCDKKFMRKITLNAHMAIHTKLRPFICDTCSKSFAIKGDLTNHQRVHSDEYKCKFCNKAFSVPSKLQRHMRIHTNQRPFICVYKNCGRAFSDKRNLDTHRHTHSDERSFKCNDCGKDYKTKNRLKEHSKAHSDNLQYKCNDCGKAYKWKANFLNHRRKHEGYICPYCKKDFVKASKLFKHKKECRAEVGSN